MVMIWWLQCYVCILMGGMIKTVPVYQWNIKMGMAIAGSEERGGGGLLGAYRLCPSRSSTYRWRAP